MVVHTDTIVALATPPGRSGIGVIRISGPRALALARILVRDQDFDPQPHRAILRSIHDVTSGEILDQALVTYFKAPHSYTGEDVVELSCHGSPVLLSHILDSLLALDARTAGPGEFTLRALSNGRLNLSQAEAVRDLINAQTGAALRQAARQVKGELSARLRPIKDGVLEVIVQLESRLEFVEDDLPGVALAQLHETLLQLSRQLDQMAATFRSGRLLKDGLKVTLAGRPNVGKSSIFNALLLRERAIVTEIPGTTRDTLSELLNLDGIPVLITDTAGLRASDDKVEHLGIERTKQAIADADLVVVVIDGSQPLNDEDREVLSLVADSLNVIAVNKSDLPRHDHTATLGDRQERIVPVSAKTGEGLSDLRQAMLEPFLLREIHDGHFLVTNARHFDLLSRANLALLGAGELLKQKVSEELILVELYNALHYLGEITGETTPDDVLSQIFSTFCIGK